MEDETAKLIAKAQKGDDSALDAIVSANIPLVKYVVSKRRYQGEYEDLVQTGALGLIKAVLRFDPDQGAEFSTFAYSCISGELLNAVKRDSPRAVISLDAPEAKGLLSACESCSTVYRETDRAENRLLTEQLLSSLPERERELIELRYFSGLSQKQTGSRLGLSQPQVSRLEKRAINQLRKHII